MKKSFFIIFSVFLLFILACFNIKISNAGIYFISKTNPILEGEEDKKPCQIKGYTKTAINCIATGKILNDVCEENHKYGKTCVCDRNIYRYTINDCKAPSVLDYNDYCVNPDNSRFYKTCSCTPEYSQTCSGNLEGVGTACNGKYTSCKCKSNFMKCPNDKGDTSATSCTDDTGTKYTSCMPSCSLTPSSCAATYGGTSNNWTVDGDCTTCIDNRKYVLTTETIEYLGIKLYRIKAIKTFWTEAESDCNEFKNDVCNMQVNKGDLGGYIASESNLSQSGKSWVAENAEVSGGNISGGKIFDDAKVSGGNIFSGTSIGEYATISGGDFLGSAKIRGYAQIFGGYIGSNTVGTDTMITGNARIYAGVYIRGYTIIYGNAVLNDSGWDTGSVVSIKDNAKIGGTTNINGDFEVSGDAEICSGKYGGKYIKPRPTISSGKHGC